MRFRQLHALRRFTRIQEFGKYSGALFDIHPGAIYVIENSKFYDLFCDMKKLDSVTVCKKEDVPEVLLTKKNFVFIDSDEYNRGIGDYLWSIYLFKPPNLLSFSHLYVLALHFDRIQEVADSIDKAAEKDGKKVLLHARDITGLIMMDLLYLLCKSADIVAKLNKRAYFSMFDPNTPVSVNAASADKHILVIWNQNTRNLVQHRLFLQARKDFDVYFIHGEKSSRSNASFLHDPILFWAIPFTGCGRLLSTLPLLLPRLGFYFYKTDLIYDFHKVPSNDVSESQYSQKNSNDGGVLDFIDLMLPSSVILLHRCAYSMDVLLKKKGTKLVVLTRDFRDLIISTINRKFASEIRIRNIPIKPLVIDGIKNLLVNIPSTLSLDYMTKLFTHLKNDFTNTYFLKLEDINQDPFLTYHLLFTWLGIADDPFYDTSQMKNAIEQAASASHPDNLTWHKKDKEWSENMGKERLVIGASGKWNTIFDEEVKDLFKANSNGFLQTFGYEKDDNW